MAVDARWMFALSLTMAATAGVAWLADWRDLEHLRPVLPGFALFFAYSTGWYACKSWG